MLYFRMLIGKTGITGQEKILTGSGNYTGELTVGIPYNRHAYSSLFLKRRTYFSLHLSLVFSPPD
ncbi:hypothetical protein NQ318_018977 [Aromia moschata]|uniref:Uncharacterized protein n=1 Tax=Aromia moschata TaxID=1265417 RepID=A0AAV8Y747_9CUCU|nr:hypothetical protein NQ318_018977 [Aromia moschata]